MSTISIDWAWGAAWGAALGLAARDLIGQHDLPVDD